MNPTHLEPKAKCRMLRTSICLDDCILGQRMCVNLCTRSMDPFRAKAQSKEAIIATNEELGRAGELRPKCV